MLILAVLVVLTLTAPIAAREVQRRLGPRLAGWETEIAFWARAAYGAVPLYGAWITGTVLGIDCGLTGFSATDWLAGMAICALLLGALAVSLRVASKAHVMRTWFCPDGSWLPLFDEPRWSFYRGAGAVPLPNPAAAQAVGLLLGVLEWLIRHGRPGHATPPAVWSGLLRLGISAGLFALTHNLWLILLTQAAAQALVQRATARLSSTA